MDRTFKNLQLGLAIRGLVAGRRVTWTGAWGREEGVIQSVHDKLAQIKVSDVEFVIVGITALKAL